MSLERFKKQVFTIEPSASIRDAAEKMRNDQIGNLVVTNKENQPVGVVTDRDIVRFVVAKGLDPEVVKVEDIMAKRPEVARVQDGILETVRRMQINGFRRLPIVDQNRSVVGVIAVDDVLDLLARQLYSVARIGPRQIGKERSEKTLSERFDNRANT